MKKQIKNPKYWETATVDINVKPLKPTVNMLFKSHKSWLDYFNDLHNQTLPLGGSWYIPFGSSTDIIVKDFKTLACIHGQLVDDLGYRIPLKDWLAHLEYENHRLDKLVKFRNQVYLRHIEVHRPITKQSLKHLNRPSYLQALTDRNKAFRQEVGEYLKRTRSAMVINIGDNWELPKSCGVCQSTAEQLFSNFNSVMLDCEDALLRSCKGSVAEVASPKPPKFPTWLVALILIAVLAIASHFMFGYTVVTSSNSVNN